jgi:lipid-binding SYLF domain-containing protein
MKAMWLLTLGVLLCGVPAQAQISGNEQDRLQKAAEVVTAMRDAPDKGIPQELWEKANCVVVLPDVKKAAFGIGGEFGKGLMSCRTATGWSAPAFMEMAKGSFGFQIGGQEADLVLLVMNRKASTRCSKTRRRLAPTRQCQLVRSDGRRGRHGDSERADPVVFAFEGSVRGYRRSGGVLRPDKDANAHAYGASVVPYDVVMGTARVMRRPRRGIRQRARDERPRDDRSEVTASAGSTSVDPASYPPILPSPQGRLRPCDRSGRCSLCHRVFMDGHTCCWLFSEGSPSES